VRDPGRKCNYLQGWKTKLVSPPTVQPALTNIVKKMNLPRLFPRPNRNENTTRVPGPTTLMAESLEERQMLSTVSIFAQGTTGSESFEVFVDDVSKLFVSESADLPTHGFREFQFDADLGVDANDIRIEFLNDEFDPESGFDRNLIIDKIRVGERLYETENSAVFSTGTWTAADGVQDGFGRGDTLHANGFLQYSQGGFSGFADITNVQIDAAGFGDSVSFELQVDGETVRNYALSARAGVPSGVFDYTLNGDVSADRIRIAFTNDIGEFTEPISGSTIDRNLLINSVTIDDEVYRGADSDVFSTGTWLPQDGVADGFGRGNILHANGYFQFAERSGPETIQITVDATAVGQNVDDVRFEIQIDGQSDGFFGITPLRTGNFDRVVTIEVPADVTPDRVRVAFTTDLFTETRDRNLRINSVTIGDQTFDPADPTVFSTGTWRPEDGVVDGFGRGNILHANGYFQFG